MPVKLNGEYFWLVPQNLNLPELLLKYPPNFPFKVKIDHFYYIIDYIISRMDWNDFDVNGAYVNINAQKWQLFNHNYLHYLNYLCQYPAILLSDRYFILGEKTRGYRFICGCDDIELILITDHTIYKKVRDKFNKSTLRQVNKIKGHKHLTKWFNESLQIDGGKAREEIELLYPRTGMKLGLNRSAGKLRAGKDSKRFRALSSIVKLEFKNYQYTVDPNIGRFHSNLTNIKKELRKYISYSSYRLVNVDLKSSQPWLSQMLLKKEFYSEGSPLHIGMFDSVIKLCKNEQEYKDKVTSVLTTITLVETEENHTGKGFQPYLTLFNNNDFYRDLQKNWLRTLIERKKKSTH